MKRHTAKTLLTALIYVLPLVAAQLVPSALTVAQDAPPDRDAQRLRERAEGILHAYRARDVDAIVSYVQPDERNGARVVLTSSRAASFFGPNSWRWQAVNAWDGQLGEVRVQGDRARVLFHRMGADEVAVVSLRWYQDAWYFTDVHSPSRLGFDSWGEALP